MIHLVCPNPALDRTILINDFQPNKVNRPLAVYENAGGKSFNVAYALNKESENQDNLFCIHTMLGGMMGKYIEQLNQQNNNALIITQVEKNTRTCTIHVDCHAKNTYLVYEPGFTLTTDLLTIFTNNLLKNIKSGDSVVFSGSLMQGMPNDYIVQIARQLPKDVQLIVDTSGEALRQAYQCQPKMIKINDEELADLFPQFKIENPQQILTVLKNHLTEDIPYFIVTLGAKGIIAKLKNQFYQITLPQIEVKNPIASGDFFLGIITYYISRGELMIDHLITACAYASANCLQWTPKVDNTDMLTIKEQIKVQHII